MRLTFEEVSTKMVGFSLAMMIASMFAVNVVQAVSFIDVQPSDWFYSYVEDLAAQDILDTSSSSYRPGDLANRAEMAKLVVEAFDLSLETPTEAPFEDVPLDQWFTSYIYTAQKNGLIGGYKDNTGELTGYFGPSDPLTREQAMKMIVLAAPLTINTQGAPHFSDLPLSSWSYEYVETGYNYSVVDGYPDGSFKPENSINRAEIAKFISNGMNPVLRSDAGGDLTCTSGEQPDSISVPKGATGILFTALDCSSSGDPVVLSSMTFHRFGAGDETDLVDVYLYEGDYYEGDYLLTSSSSINSEAQNVEFSDLNLEIDGTVSLWVVADIYVAAETAAQHGFELLDADAIGSDAGNVDGDFPIQGNLMTISGAIADTVTINKNGSLDDLVIGEIGRMAQFELEASDTDAMEFERIALYVRGTCDSSDLSDFELYVEGGSEVLATADEVDSKDLLTFVLDDPYLIYQGDSKIFYAEVKNTCRNGETIDTWLDETTDLHVTGVTFGTGVLVDNTDYDGGAGDFSTVTINGSDFTVAFNGPGAGDIAIGEDSVSCLDLTITNASDGDLEIRDWELTLEVLDAYADGDDGDLINGTYGTANYTLIKLALVNADGSIGASLLGPSELPSVADDDDDTQLVVLDGSSTIDAGESIDVAIVFDLANEPAMDGNMVRCTLTNVAEPGRDFVRDLNGDALGAESITPSTDITGNTFTIY